MDYKLMRSFMILFAEAQGPKNKLGFLKYAVENFFNRFLHCFSHNCDVFLEFKGVKIWFGHSASELSSYIEIFVKKEYEIDPDFMAREDDIVFDIGANVGLYAIKQAQRAKNGRIFAFEPNPYAFARLKKNIEANNLKNIISFNNAIYSKRCKLGIGFCTSSTRTSIRLKGDTVQRLVIEAVPLDEIVREWEIKHINLMKIDVEGAELEVLKGAKQSLEITEKIVMECHSEQLKQQTEDFLLEKGFNVKLELNKNPFYLVYFIKGG